MEKFYDFRFYEEKKYLLQKMVVVLAPPLPPRPTFLYGPDIYTQNNIMENSYEKQFGLRVHHSIDHALVKLVDGLFDSFNERKHRIGTFVDLSKAFDTVDHEHFNKKTSTLWCSRKLSKLV